MLKGGRMMRLKKSVILACCMVLSGALFATIGLLAAPPTKVKAKAKSAKKTDATKKQAERKRVSVSVAREQAKLAHSIYAVTLDVVHHRYFRRDKSTIPARALEEVFPRVAREHGLQARWIAVNANAMSIDHRPRNGFEKKAAKVLATGAAEYETVSDGIYRRAGSISLMDKGCLGCHLGLGASGKIKRFAGLVISIPVK